MADREHLRCYICGQRIGDIFMLFSPTTDVDRVFVCHTDECAEQVEEDARTSIMVKKALNA